MSAPDPFTAPSEVAPLPPAFPALFAGECSRCLAFFAAGDLIRADSCGDWECADHESLTTAPYPPEVRRDRS